MFTLANIVSLLGSLTFLVTIRVCEVPVTRKTELMNLCPSVLRRTLLTKRWLTPMQLGCSLDYKCKSEQFVFRLLSVTEKFTVWQRRRVPRSNRKLLAGARLASLTIIRSGGTLKLRSSRRAWFGRRVVLSSDLGEMPRNSPFGSRRLPKCW